MLKRRTAALLLALAAALSLFSVPTLAAEEAREERAPVIPPDKEGTVSFENLDARIRENDLNYLIMEETIAGMEAVDYDQYKEYIRKQLNSLATAQWNTQFGILSAMPAGILSYGDQIAISTATSIASSSLQSSYDSLRDVFEDLKDGEIQKDAADALRQLYNSRDAYLLTVESVYIGMVEAQAQRESLRRVVAALDRRVEEMELRYQLGQISALALEQIRGQRTAYQSNLDTLDMKITTGKYSLEQMLGEEVTGAIRLMELPDVPQEDLDAMDVEADLARAKELSYELYAAEVAKKDARTDWLDDSRTYENEHNLQHFKYEQAQHAWQVAQYTYDNTIKNYEVRFRVLYQQVKDYEQVLRAAREALALERDEYAAEQTKYDLGNLSQNALANAKDEVSAAEDSAATARRNLFTAYNNYRWAVEYGILN